ncbi:glucose-6-phosphate isomerase [Arthrobacter castelli]|uniref:glucose-6-phosphate isomerase n=1 Tax=Arthrobacter castelli TaxID=271431 RepID=UPI0003F8DC00|nr:glucose-6-phosphate isomerase [Arthrobacter castelli]
MSSLSIMAASAAQHGIDRHIGALVADQAASRITAQDPTLWGPDAEAEAAKRLGWVELADTSRPLVPRILQLREELAAEGITRIALAGMGGSSLAPEVITATAGVELTVLDSTDPEQVRAALEDRLAETAVVVSSKSGSTLETDSLRRIFEQTFTEAGIDAGRRIIVVTDPGSPMDEASRKAGYREVFNADPNVGGRYSALTAFGLVPSGLAGVDIEALLDDAEEASEVLRDDASDNIGLVLGAALAGTDPLRNKIVIVDEGSSIVGFADWAEQLIAESTGKFGTGLLPVVAGPDAPETSWQAPDMLVVRLVAADTAVELNDNEIAVAGSLGSQLLAWEYATAVAGRLLGINPFDQPDVEAAKEAARGLLESRPEQSAAAFVDGAIQVRGATSWLGNSSSLDDALRALIEQLPADGYLSVQAYFDRIAWAPLEEIRDPLARISGRPVTFGWGPRFLHSTGQFHKGGPAVGVFLQVTAASELDVPIPDRPFSFGQLISAQAAGDAQVLAGHGRPVLQLHLADREAGVTQLKDMVSFLNHGIGQ